MEMTYDGALVLPSNCVTMDEEEMEYTDGGIYIRKGIIVWAAAHIGAAVYAKWVGATKYAWSICGKVIAAFHAFTKWLCSGGVAGIALKIIGCIGAGVVGWYMGKALWYGKGISVSWSGVRVC